MTAYTNIGMDQAHHEKWFISQNDVRVSSLRLGEPSRGLSPATFFIPIPVRQLHASAEEDTTSRCELPLLSTTPLCTTEAPLHY